MSNLARWEAIGVICGALLALLTLVGLLYRKVVRPVWRAGWRTIRRLNRFLDDLEGDKAEGRLSLREEVERLNKRLSEHIDWHSAAGRGNASRPSPRPGSRT
jgi:hypothetical protein